MAAVLSSHGAPHTPVGAPLLLGACRSLHEEFLVLTREIEAVLQRRSLAKHVALRVRAWRDRLLHCHSFCGTPALERLRNMYLGLLFYCLAADDWTHAPVNKVPRAEGGPLPGLPSHTACMLRHRIPGVLLRETCFVGAAEQAGGATSSSSRVRSASAYSTRRRIRAAGGDTGTTPRSQRQHADGGISARGHINHNHLVFSNTIRSAAGMVDETTVDVGHPDLTPSVVSAGSRKKNFYESRLSCEQDAMNNVARPSTTTSRLSTDIHRDNLSLSQSQVLAAGVEEFRRQVHSFDASGIRTEHSPPPQTGGSLDYLDRARDIVLRTSVNADVVGGPLPAAIGAAVPAAETTSLLNLPERSASDAKNSHDADAPLSSSAEEDEMVALVETLAEQERVQNEQRKCKEYQNCAASDAGGMVIHKAAAASPPVGKLQQARMSSHRSRSASREPIAESRAEAKRDDLSGRPHRAEDDVNLEIDEDDPINDHEPRAPPVGGPGRSATSSSSNLLFYPGDRAGRTAASPPRTRERDRSADSTGRRSRSRTPLGGSQHGNWERPNYLRGLPTSQIMRMPPPQISSSISRASSGKKPRRVSISTVPREDSVLSPATNRSFARADANFTAAIRQHSTSPAGQKPISVSDLHEAPEMNNEATINSQGRVRGSPNTSTSVFLHHYHHHENARIHQLEKQVRILTSDNRRLRTELRRGQIREQRLRNALSLREKVFLNAPANEPLRDDSAVLKVMMQPVRSEDERLFSMNVERAISDASAAVASQSKSSTVPGGTIAQINDTDAFLAELDKRLPASKGASEATGADDFLHYLDNFQNQTKTLLDQKTTAASSKLTSTQMESSSGLYGTEPFDFGTSSSSNHLLGQTSGGGGTGVGAPAPGDSVEDLALRSVFAADNRRDASFGHPSRSSSPGATTGQQMVAGGENAFHSNKPQPASASIFEFSPEKASGNDVLERASVPLVAIPGHASPASARSRNLADIIVASSSSSFTPDPGKRTSHTTPSAQELVDLIDRSLTAV
ncbi:unnamed protein product [Amoebophrya sp. A25]|nr:unnamed protein product [Amoebophrya sp. A25]|eukprot:GSA25T00001056001.1